jgi:hypothetical protein
MSVINWINATVASFNTPSAWQGGEVPNSSDTAVIGSAGDPLPVQNPATDILSPAAGESLAFLAGLTLDQETLVLGQEGNGQPFYYLTTPPANQVPAGETIAGGIIDLLGGGSEASLALQDSTLAKPVQLNVSGDAYFYSGYTNALDGTINIGLPFKINGVTVPPPPPDANGYVNAVYLDIQDYGSWDDEDKLSGYVPGTTNNGTINISGIHSTLYLSIAGQQESVGKYNGLPLLNPPTVSAFINDGVINVQAGGTIHALSEFGEGEFINNGKIEVTGAAGDTTLTNIATQVSGTGTFVLNGGTQTNPLATGAYFTDNVTGVNFSLDDAALRLNAGTDTEVPTLVCSGGNVAFTGANGALLIDAPVDDPIKNVFTDTISGFASSDQVQLTYNLLPLTKGETWKPVAEWDAKTNTLDVYNTYSGIDAPGPSLEAAFVLKGSYTQSSFSAAGVWNGELDTPAVVTITTTELSPHDWLGSLAPDDWATSASVGQAAMGAFGLLAEPDALYHGMMPHDAGAFHVVL